MEAKEIINHVFEGKDIRTIIYKDRRVWVCSDICTALGYKYRRKLAAQIRNDWKNEFIEGEHYILPIGRDLIDFDRLYSSVTQKVSLGGNSLLLLTERGIDPKDLPSAGPEKQMDIEDLVP